MPVKSMSSSAVAARLLALSAAIDHRAGSLKNAEEKRVGNAFRLLASPNAGKTEPYRNFLDQVQKKIGDFAVVLVAASGPTVIMALKEHERDELLGQLFEQRSKIARSHLHSIWTTYAEKYLRRTGQTSILYTVDLASFLLKYKDKYPSIRVNLGLEENDHPSIELSNEILQELIIHTREINAQREAMGSGHRSRPNVQHSGTPI